MRETDVCDTVTGTDYGVWFTTEREDGSLWVTIERVVMGDPVTGEDVEVDLDHETTERLAERIADRIENGGML